MKRRESLKVLGLIAGLSGSASRLLAKDLLPGPDGMIRKQIPSSGEAVPVIGMGTWLTFNVPTSGPVFEARLGVLREFFRHGGGLVDASPMYGNAEAVMGACLRRLGGSPPLFSATKVWSPGTDGGREQYEASFRLWSRELIDLQQVHNLVNWQSHLELLRSAKAEGRIRYIGMTTSHGRRHPELARILRTEPIDFVQLTYNAARTASEPLIKLAADRGVAVIVNRPLGGGALIERVQRETLPEWAKDAGIRNWPDFLLRWIVSHPAVTCAIPATTQVEHMRENMAAGQMPVLDEPLRRRMQRYISQL